MHDEFEKRPDRSIDLTVPTCGRIVHFVLGDGQIRPAIVIRTGGEKVVENGFCPLTLHVFLDDRNDFDRGFHPVPYSSMPAVGMMLRNSQYAEIVESRGCAYDVPFHGGDEDVQRDLIITTYPPNTWHWAVRA